MGYKDTLRKRKKDTTSSSSDGNDGGKGGAASTPTNFGRRITLFLLTGWILIMLLMVMISRRNSESTTEEAPVGGTGENPTTTTTTNQQQNRYTSFSTYQLMEVVPHEPQSFAQGLTVGLDDKILYESTGELGFSQVRKIDLESGEVVQRRDLDSSIHANGMTYYPDEGGGRLLLLTKSKRALIYDSESLDLVTDFPFETTTLDGWGVTYNPKNQHFFVSDGSPFLHVWELIHHDEGEEVTYREIERVEVTVQTEGVDQDPQQVPGLNELEWDDSTETILANVLDQDVILRIDPKSGMVITVYSFRDLYNNRLEEALSFNGVAMNSKKEVWITGQYWPQMYKVSLF